ncbi:phage tail spike protein [Staphylococcus delphini]|uniref:phage tail spike protein n=1 Tax=Staphylococcus delphini TaxID=53344 RepID=UPI0021D0DCA2|nr:phage tail spike protein [Staphylococcus delphini]UXS45368.1 carbohydrate binding domain-containing protein [Staphylococcus delphini]UXV45990.1 carbohydrate binding domain-containing protein [Staphylococcus delphini]
MIHVMNFKGEIVDFISHSDNAVIQAVHNRNINERMETFEFTILSERTTHLQERNRIIIQDKNGQYREFIIDRISADIDGYTEVETVASYLEDITKARPYAPGKLEKMTTKQALSDVLKDTGWEVSDATEYGGIRTTSWTSYQTRYDVLLQLCTTYDMMADFYIEVGSNRVDKRLVVLRKRNPLFKGKEIEYGKDLIGLKRTVDFSEIKTALLCVGPEPEEGKKRLELVVKDDEAQAKYGLPGRYNWGVYEPESSEQNMSESRLRTLGTTELNKRKSEVITYEVTAVDIEKEFKHEIVNLGDKVRIKDREFTPPLYVEAEVISEEYDLIGEDATYTFGEYKEFKESDLRSPFDKKLDAIRQKLSDGLSNVNTIVKESLEGELQYFERKILKGDTPPDNPVNDLLWLDTSNPKVAVLRRYWNGEWIKSSAENAGDVGAVTREQALYSELSNTFVNLTIQHSRLMHDASEALESEYLVDTDIKANVSSKLNDTIGVFNQIKQNLDSMTSETATIGKLVDTQALFLEYREKMQALYNTIENAKIAIDERFKLLQSQYTDEKYNKAMEKIATVLPNGQWNAETGQLTGDIPNQERLSEIEIALQQNLTDQINGAKEILNNQVDAKLLQLKDEVNISVRKISEEVDGVKIGGRNLLSGTTQEYLDSKFIEYKHTIGYVDGKKTVGWTNTNNITAIAKQNVRLEAGKSYTFSFYAKSSEPLNLQSVYLNGKNNRFLSSTKITNNWERYHFTFIPTKTTESVTPHFYPEILKSDGSYKTFYVTDVQLESGNQLSDVNPSPEDIKRAIKSSEGAVKDYAETQKQLAINEANDEAQKALEPIKIRTTQAENSIRALEDALVLKATKTEVERTLNDSLKPVQTKVDEQQARLQIMSDSINSKVSQSDYTIDKNNIVERLDNSDSERKQLSNQIADRVTRSEYENDVEQRLVNSKAEMLIEAEQTSDRVSKEVFNENSKTLERYTSEFINNVSTGMSFNYDDNGNIQSANVGPDGIKLKGDRVDITVNKDFNVLVNDVANKADETNIVNKINLSREGLEIDVNNVGIRGGDSSEYVHIKNDEITLYGTYTRDWVGATETNNVFTRLKDGHIRFRNNDKDRSIYISDLGISTFLDGTPTEASGTIQFFDYLYDSNARGLTIRSGLGVLGLRSENNKIVMEADDTVNIGSNKYSIYLRPFANTRSGINEFQFYVKDNTDPKDTDGVLLFGELSDPSRVAGSGIRFRKQGVRGHENISEMEPLVYATNNNGDIGSGSFYGSRLYGDWTAKVNNVYACVDDKLRVTDKRGYNNGDPEYKNLQVRDIQANSIRINTGNNFYLGVSTGELRVTNNLLYNGGSIGYKPVRASAFNNSSLAEYKKDIKLWNYDALSVITNDLELYQYKYKDDSDQLLHRGVVIGDGYATPSEFIFGDGVNLYEMLTWSLRAIQQLNDKINKLEEDINEQLTS